MVWRQPNRRVELLSGGSSGDCWGDRKQLQTCVSLFLQVGLDLDEVVYNLLTDGPPGILVTSPVCDSKSSPRGPRAKNQSVIVHGKGASGGPKIVRYYAAECLLEGLGTDQFDIRDSDGHRKPLA